MPINIEDHEEIDCYVKHILKNSCGCIDEPIAKIIITQAFNAGRWNYHIEKINNKIHELENGEV